MSDFDYEAFIDSIDGSLDDYDEPQLDRAWDIVKGCMEVHARVDRRSDESASEALALAWEDYWACFRDGEDTSAPYLYWGMVWEMLYSVGEKSEDLAERITQAGFDASAKKGRRGAGRKNVAMPKLVATKHPHLKVVK